MSPSNKEPKILTVRFEGLLEKREPALIRKVGRRLKKELAKYGYASKFHKGVARSSVMRFALHYVAQELGLEAKTLTLPPKEVQE